MVTTARKKPFIFSEQQEEYLKEIYKYRFLTAVQLTRLRHKMGTKTTVQERLKQLENYKYIASFQLPTVKSKSPYIYAVIGKGIKYLEDLQIEATAYYRLSELQELSHGFLHHVLELNDFLIAAKRVNSVNAAFRLEKMQHDLDLKKDPIKVSYTPLNQKA